jgi:hypothetical protein
VGRQHGIGRAGVDAFAGATEAGQVRPELADEGQIQSDTLEMLRSEGAPTTRSIWPQPRQRPYRLARAAGEAADRRSAGEGPRAPNAVPVLEALSPLTRRAARAGLSALRALRDPHALPLPPRLRRAHARFAGRGNMAAGAAGGKAAWNRPRGVDAFAGATEAAQVRPGVNDPTLTLVALGRPHEQDSGRAGPRVRQPALIAPA